MLSSFGFASVETRAPLAPAGVPAGIAGVMCSYNKVNGSFACANGNRLHRDLKPQNILLNDKGVIKICDFGLARAIDPSEDKKDMGLTDYVGTRRYRAPELLVDNQT